MKNYLDDCSLTFDIDKISNEIASVLSTLNVDIEERLTSGKDKDKSTQASININHPNMDDYNVKALIGQLDVESAKYYGPLTAGFWPLVKSGVDPSSFKTVGKLFKGTYIEEVIEKVKEHHALTLPGLPPVTRVFCAYLGPGAGFTFHKDRQTYYKYHLPIKTNRWSLMYTGNETTLEGIHLPADGKLWRLNTSEMHTALNLSPNENDYRMHIIFNVYK